MSKPVFKNRPNPSHKIDGRVIWESRSAAVNGVVIVYPLGAEVPYVLVSERGPKAADFRGLLNVIAGYMDWDEDGTEAIYRECWEEVGLDLKSFVFRNKNAVILRNDLDDPWKTKTKPDENRQNISLRYGVALDLYIPSLPKLSLEHNEIPGEVSKAWWMPVDEIDNYKWAFNHDQVIKDYLVLLSKEPWNK